MTNLQKNIDLINYSLIQRMQQDHMFLMINLRLNNYCDVIFEIHLLLVLSLFQLDYLTLFSYMLPIQ